MSEAAPSLAAHDLAYYLAPIRRRRRIVIAFVLVGLILGGAAAVTLRPTYTAAALVSVGQDPTTSGAGNSATGGRTTGSGPNMDTEAQLAKSRTVAILAAAELDNGTAPGVLQTRLAITVPANTTTLRIAFTAHSPKAAAAGAKAFADAYLKNRRNNSEQILNGEIQTVQDNLDAANKARTADLDKQHAIPRSQHNTTAYNNAVQQVTNDTVKINTLTATLTGLQTTTLEPGTISSLPNASGLAPSPLREISVATGLILGLLVGLVGAFTRDRLDPTIRSRTDIEMAGVPVLADIPKPVGSRRDRKSGRLDKEDAAARRKANQRVATGIAAALGADGGSIYVSNLSPAEHADHLADDLARELGRFGSTVEIAGRGEDSIGTSWDPAGYAAGLAHRDHAEFTDLDTSLHTRAAVAVVEQALARSRFVIIDGLGDFEGLEPYVLSSLGQVSVIVVEPGSTTRAELAEAVDQMSMTSCHLLGALMWHPPTPANAPSGNGFRRVPPRALESGVTVEPTNTSVNTSADAPPASGQARPHPGRAAGDEAVGWPSQAGSAATSSSTHASDDIQDAEIVNDEADPSESNDTSSWHNASRD